MLITRPDNTPFKNQFAARMYASRRYVEYKIIPHLEGFAVETDGIEKEKQSKQQDKVPAKILETANSSATATKKHRVTTPWKPAPLLDFHNKYKDPNYTYRFVKKDRAGNIQKKLSEQWEIDTEVANKIAKDNPELLSPTINDGVQSDRSFQIREMLLMKIPNELASSRAEYYEKRNMASQESAEETYKTQNVNTYGKVTITR